MYQNSATHTHRVKYLQESSNLTEADVTRRRRIMSPNSVLILSFLNKKVGRWIFLNYYNSTFTHLHLPNAHQTSTNLLVKWILNTTLAFTLPWKFEALSFSHFLVNQLTEGSTQGRWTPLLYLRHYLLQVSSYQILWLRIRLRKMLRKSVCCTRGTLGARARTACHGSYIRTGAPVSLGISRSMRH